MAAPLGQSWGKTGRHVRLPSKSNKHVEYLMSNNPSQPLTVAAAFATSSNDGLGDNTKEDRPLRPQQHQEEEMEPSTPPSPPAKKLKVVGPSPAGLPAVEPRTGKRSKKKSKP